jgi:hypothetical protein
MAWRWGRHRRRIRRKINWRRLEIFPQLEKARGRVVDAVRETEVKAFDT